MTREEFYDILDKCRGGDYWSDLAIDSSVKYVYELEQHIAELEYNYSCVLDCATGGRASKTNIDLNTAYKLIADNTNFWVESAITELEAPKTCEGCIYKDKIPLQGLYMQCGICTRNSVIICDYYEPKEIK